jgi:hypothetical protein
MKAALFLVAFFTSINAMAQVYVMPNEGGGEITLTSRPCEYRGKIYDGVKEAYTWSNQMYITGCWNVIDGNVHIVWNVNDRAERRVYNINSFTRR